MSRTVLKSDKILPKVVVVLAGVVVVLIALTVNLSLRLDDAESLGTGSAIQSHQNYYNLEKISFCYNRSIRPCNDDTLYEWNNAHDDDAFAIKSDYQLGQDLQ
jgi:hypothetical protein